jgi:phosphoglycolate phosphatase
MAFQPENPMKFSHLIFDLDGTLVDSARLTGQILDSMLADRGVAMSADRDLIRAMDAVGGEAMIAAVMGRHTSDPATDLGEFRERHKIAATPPDLAFPGVTAGLAHLASAGVVMAICSNKPQHLCEKILTDLDLAKHFTAIIGSSPDRPRKPAPDAALLALRHLGAEPGSTLYCGDSLVDLATARAAGLAMVLVEWGYGVHEAFTSEPGTRVISDFEQLLSLTGAGLRAQHG